MTRSPRELIRSFRSPEWGETKAPPGIGEGWDRPVPAGLRNLGGTVRPARRDGYALLAPPGLLRPLSTLL